MLYFFFKKGGFVKVLVLVLRSSVRWEQYLTAALLSTLTTLESGNSPIIPSHGHRWANKRTWYRAGQKALRFFCKILWRNSNELCGQLNEI